jgi:hypothetical protein
MLSTISCEPMVLVSAVLGCLSSFMTGCLLLVQLYQVVFVKTTFLSK